jgi:hypothetical protein
MEKYLKEKKPCQLKRKGKYMRHNERRKIAT